MTLSIIANHIASYLDQNLAAGEEKSEIYAYGLEILLGATIKLFTILALAWLFNSFANTLVVLVTYATFRWFGGGAHMSTYFRCLLFGVIVIVGLGSLSKLNLDTSILKNLTVLAILFSLYVCYKWVPGDTEKKPIKEKDVRLKQKEKMSVLIMLYGFTVFFLVQYCMNTYVLALIIGCVSSVFLITPWGFRLLVFVDKLIPGRR